MENKNVLFETELTDGSLFRKYKKISGYLILLFFLLGFGFTLLGNVFPEDKIDNIQHPFAIFNFSLLVIAIIFYFYSIKKNVQGTLRVFDDKIEIQKNSSHVYFYNQLSDFEIQRGSTFHYSHQIDNELIKVNNYIRFNVEGEANEFEFLIDSKKKNSAFESMINILQRNQIKLHYTSI